MKLEMTDDGILTILQEMCHAWHIVWVMLVMDILVQLFGDGKELTSLQMALRAVIVFIIAIVLLRLSGRRAFGIHSPFDHVISILIGAILSRAVVGASPFVPVIIASCVIVLLYRFFGWLSIKSDTFSRIIKGDPVLIYKDGK